MPYPTLLTAAFLTATLSAQSIPTEDRALIQSLQRALQIAQEGGEDIWPGYDITQIPIAIFRSGSTAYLVQHPEPPKGYAQIDTTLVATALYRGPHLPQMNANTAGQVNGSVTAFIDAGSLSGDEVTDAALILHECGHAFQARAPDGGKGRWPLEDSRLVATYPVTDATNNAWGRIEGQILRAALLAEDIQSIRRHLCDFIAVREHRQSHLPDQLQRFELHLELNEGLADYLSLRALAITDLGEGRLSQLHDRLQHINVAGKGAGRQRFYSTGAAQALLLDRLAPHWKRDLEATGVSLQKLLQRALQDDASTNAMAVAQRWGLDTYLEFEQLAARSKRRQLRTHMLDVLAANTTKLVIDLSHAGGSGQIGSYDPMNLHAIDASMRVHTRMLTQAFRGGSSSYAQPVIQDLERDWMITTLPDTLSLQLDGEDLSAPAQGDFIALEGQILSLEAQGINLKAGPSWILWEDDLLIIVPGGIEEPATEEALELIERAKEEISKPVPAPPFEIRDRSGALQRHPDGTNQPRALLFFSAAAWAKPAQRYLRELLETLDGEQGDLPMLLIATQSSLTELDTLLPDPPEKLPLILDGDGSLRELFGIGNLPTLVWIDAEGNIESKTSGYGAERVRTLAERLTGK